MVKFKHMKASYLVITLILFYSKLAGQTQSPDNKNSIQFSLGFSKHGTGDLNGYFTNFEHIHDFKKRSFVSIGFSATLHSGVVPLFYLDQSGNTIDGSYRYVTGGFQIESRFGLYFVKSNKNRLGGSLGPIIRYQSSSYYDDLSILYPAGTGLPIPVMALINRTPQNNITIGGKVTLFYNYQISAKNYIGLNCSFQTDSQTDAISSFMLAVGWKL
jgi:hypothetical protein